MPTAIVEKSRKAEYHRKEAEVLKAIDEIYHEKNGVPGYRMIHILLQSKGISLSTATCHRYIHGELELYSVTRRHKPGYRKGTANKVFKNLINQKFKTEELDKIWCTDFTYIPLKNISRRYNCAIIDLYDGSVIASVCERNITAELALKQLKKPLLSTHGC